MTTDRIALVTGANQGIGRRVAADLAADHRTVFVGSRDAARGERAAAEIGGSAVAVQLDVTDPASVAAAADRIADEAGRLDLLVNNAGISTTRRVGLAEFRRTSTPGTAPLDDVRAVWEVNVLGVLSVYQAVLPLLRRSGDARVVNVTSALGSLSLGLDPSSPTREAYDVVYAASKTALHGVTLAMLLESATTGVKVNLVSPGFARTALTGFHGTESAEDAAREVVRVSRLGPGGASGTFTTWEGVDLPW
ncbi:SDR family NAD(P)-dependent oxidoreductase [Desertihabitans brevis]|uniref:SDR family NAD(P)-dependent oxidoreductase n=1 Tax=Desertihabitans brevis TaxID=2268447 RepID=A0A367YTN6_9ACTN|nr:SDR family NAD(P)-dependent oxidoreductase [Desertihabitans brevis]RCK69214.1 SDR family NAD(P)-dependent oxidoreductase [Desertihabitans brevis]